jgi:hypothetical protein
MLQQFSESNSQGVKDDDENDDEVRRTLEETCGPAVMASEPKLVVVGVVARIALTCIELNFDYRSGGKH